MVNPRKFLVVGSNADNAALLVRTLGRKFSDASIQPCRDSQSAIHALANHAIDAVVLHAASAENAVHLIEAFRRIGPGVPIVVVSDVDRSEPVLAAGAVAFIKSEEWLRIGTVVQKVLGLSEKKSA